VHAHQTLGSRWLLAGMPSEAQASGASAGGGHIEQPREFECRTMAGQPAAEAMEPRAGTRRNTHGSAQHELGADPGKRVPGAGPCAV